MDVAEVPNGGIQAHHCSDNGRVLETGLGFWSSFRLWNERKVCIYINEKEMGVLRALDFRFYLVGFAGSEKRRGFVLLLPPKGLKP